MCDHTILLNRDVAAAPECREVIFVYCQRFPANLIVKLTCGFFDLRQLVHIREQVLSFCLSLKL